MAVSPPHTVGRAVAALPWDRQTDTSSSWELGRIYHCMAYPCKSALCFFTFQDRSRAQGGLSASGSSPSSGGNPRPSPMGSLVIVRGTDGRWPHIHCSCELGSPPAPTKPAWGAMGCSGVTKAASMARKWMGCHFKESNQEKGTFTTGLFRVTSFSHMVTQRIIKRN